MKSLRILLNTAACVVAVTSISAIQFNCPTNLAATQNGSKSFATFEENVCCDDLTAGTQCTLKITGRPLAYSVSNSSIPLYRP